MRFQLPAHVTAGVLFLLAAAFPTGVWIVYLFVENPYPGPPLDWAISTLQYTFSAENDHRLWFAWLAALPILCSIFGVAYLLNASRSRKVALAMLALSGALAGVTLILNDWALALFVALPMIWGYRCLNAT